MNLVFCGTPHFAVPTLEAVLRAGHTVSLVLSQPDKPVGRKAELLPTPVKSAALAHGLRVEQPTTLRNNETLRADLERIAPDAILVVAYGRIIPQWMLDLPRHGNLNLHGSLLPRWRGAAPIQWAVAAGDRITGVTTMRLNAGLDTGPMLLKREIPINPNDTAADLFTSLSTIGADVMLETLRGLEAGTLTATEQIESDATLAPILTRDDGRIRFTNDADTVYNRYRGFQPWPGAWTTLREKKFTITRMHLFPSHLTAAPGSLILKDNALLAVCASNTAVVLDEVQLEGKRAMPAADFLRGFTLAADEVLA